MRQRWSAAPAWLVLAFALALGLAASGVVSYLYGRADESRRAQLLLAHVANDVNRLSALPWDAREGPKAADAAAAAITESRETVRAGLDALQRLDRDEPRIDEIRDLHAQQLEAVEQLRRLVTAGRLADAGAFDANLAGPRHEALADALAAAELAYGNRAGRAHAIASFGSVITGFAAFAAIVFLLWKFDRARAEIAERARVEQRLRELAAIVESSEDAFISASTDGLVHTWNAGAERLFGYSFDEIRGRHIALLAPPELADEQRSILRRLERGESMTRSEMVHVRKDGRRIDVSLTVSRITDGNGRTTGFSATAHDITERRAAERALLESEERFRTLVENVPGAIYRCACDASWTMEFISDEIEAIAGYPASDFVANSVRSYASVIHPGDRGQVERIVEESVRERCPFALEYRVVHADGSVRWVYEKGQGVFSGDAGPLWLDGAIVDVTERKRIEMERKEIATQRERLLAAERAQNERLRELDRLKDAFVATVSHELRTPLTSISGFIQVLLDAKAGDLTEPQRKCLTIAFRNSERLHQLVDDLLFITRVDAERLVLERQNVDLGELAEDCVRGTEPVAESSGVKLTVHTDGVPLISGDPNRLAQLLDNLVSNGIKFTPAEGCVDVRVFGRDGHIVLEVEDTGFGIPAAERPHLFERFFRTSTATEHAVQGTGLGLSIAQMIVEAHGGTIMVESEEGAGSLFRVELPLAVSTEPAAADPEPAEQSATAEAA